MVMNRRQLLLTGAWLAALAGCARVEQAPTAPSSPLPSDPPGTSPAPGPSPTPATTPSPNLPAGQVNVLIAGSDSRSANLNADARSDVICVAQLSADRSRINLVSIARDTIATMPGGRRTKINEAYAVGGIQELAKVVSATLDGLPFHNTLETGFIWFTELSTMLGGFTVDNRFASNSSGAAFAAGQLPLQGPLALTYARERKGLPNGDLDRTERHRACLTAIVDKLGELARADANGLAPLAMRLWEKVRAPGPSVDDVVRMIPIAAKLNRDSVASAMLPIARFDTVAGASVDIVDRDRAKELLSQLHVGDIRPYQKKYGLDTTPTGGRG